MRRDSKEKKYERMWRAEFRLCTLGSKKITVTIIIVFIIISEKDEMETSTMARFMCTFFIDTDVKF